MSEESKPIAPGGASPVCEICGRGYTEEEGHLTGERGPAACMRLGYERLHAELVVEQGRADDAEAMLAALSRRVAGDAAQAAKGAEEVCPVCWLKSCACSSRDQISRLRSRLSTAEKVIETLHGTCGHYEERLRIAEPALETALGALRAIMRLARCDAGREMAALDQIYDTGWHAIYAALPDPSGGAHVDALKAQKEEEK